MTKIIFLLAAGLLTLTTLAPAFASWHDNEAQICHRTSSDTNPYTVVSVDPDSGAYVTHLGHDGDFIVGDYADINEFYQDEGKPFDCMDWL